MDQYVTGSVIRRLREERRMTQSRLAELLGVSDKTVYARMKKMKGEYTLAKGRIFHLR